MKIRAARRVIDETRTIARPTPKVVLARAFHRALGFNTGYPSEVVNECLEIHRALVPRGKVRLYVPHRDMNGQLLPVGKIVAALRREIVRATGGQTTYNGSGDYVSVSGVTVDEDTAIIETYLPRRITNRLRLRLIRLFVEFGRTAKQEVVLVAVRGYGYWIPTALLLHTRHVGGLLRAG